MNRTTTPPPQSNSADESASQSHSPTTPTELIQRNTLTFAYDDDEFFTTDTAFHENSNYCVATSTSRTDLTSNRRPSSGSLVSIEVLAFLDRSGRSGMSLPSRGSGKSSASSKGTRDNDASDKCPSDDLIIDTASQSNDGEERGNWRNSTLSILESLFSDHRESMTWNPFRRDELRTGVGVARKMGKPHDCSDGRRRETIKEKTRHLSILDNGHGKKIRHRRRASHPASPINRTTVTANSCSLDEDKLEGSDLNAISKGMKDTVIADGSGLVHDEAAMDVKEADTPAKHTHEVHLHDNSSPEVVQASQNAHANIQATDDIQEKETHTNNINGNPHSSSMKENKPAETNLCKLNSHESEEASIELNDVLLSLYNLQNAQSNVDNDESDDEPAGDINMCVRTDFEKATRRSSFQKRMSESFQSGDFDFQMSDLQMSDGSWSDADKNEVVAEKQFHDSSQKEIDDKQSNTSSARRESYRSYSQRNSIKKIQRRPTTESDTGKSAISSLDSFASPIDRARLVPVQPATRPPSTQAAPISRGQLIRSNFTNMAVAPAPTLQRENSLGSMSSLGTESIDRDGIRPEDFLKQQTTEHGLVGGSNPKAHNKPPRKETMHEATKDEPSSRSNEYIYGEDQSSVTMGTFFSELQKTLTQRYSESENDRDSTQASRRNTGISALTLGSFLNDLQTRENLGSEEDESNIPCDFDAGLASFVIGMRLGHFDCHDDVIGNVNTDDDDDYYLAAKAYMGLGFSAQLKGENESSLDWYNKSLQLWEAEIGADHPSLACLHYTIGIVLSQERNELEASVHLNNALGLLKSNETIDETTRISILVTEGMIFSVLGEVGRAIDCLKKALLICQKFDLNHATVMYEMGTLLAQQGELEHAINCYKHALAIREKTVGNSYITMQTHYSLGVTLAQDDSPSSRDYALIHLQHALQLCGDDSVQAPTIIHAIGILNEKNGNYLDAANWFYKELSAIKLLYGDDDERVGMCSSDVGAAFYQIGKYDIANKLFEQALQILLHITEDEQSFEVADLLYKIASCHESLCEYNEALGIFEEVKQIRLTHAGMDSSPVIQTMLRIGNVHLARGDAQTALDCFNEIVGIGYSSDSINGIEVANAFYGKGCAQFILFQLSDGMKSLNESLNWKLAALGEDDPGLACIFYQMAHIHLQQAEEEDAIICFEEYSRLLKLDNHRNLQDNAEICHTAGVVSKLKGQHDNALAFYSQALAMFQALFGNQQKHEKLASIHFDIGCIHALKGDNKEALRQLQLCLATRKQLLGTHIEVANVLYEMAKILQKVGMAKPAAMCLEESDSIWQAKLGRSEKLISVHHESGKLWKSLMRYEEAEKNLEMALELAITLHGQSHFTVATILLDLGELLHESGEYEQALFCYDESLGTHTSLFGPDDLKVANVFYCKGVALLFQGKFVEALDSLDRSLAIRQEKLGDMNSDVADTLNTIGFLQLRKGDVTGESALSPLTKALEIRYSLGNKAKVVSTLQNLASLYKKRKEFDLCMEMHSKILAVRQEEFGTNDEKVAEAWINLGNVQTTAGLLVEAAVSYEEALRIRTLINGYNHSSVAHVLFKLGLLSSRQNNYDNAKQLFEEYIRIRADEEDDPDQEMAQALSLIGDIQSDTGEKSKAQMNYLSAIEMYLNLGFAEDNPKVVKLKAKQKSAHPWFNGSRLSGIHALDVSSDWSSVVDAPMSLFNRLTSVNSRSSMAQSEFANK